MTAKKLFLIAGEASGDTHGARLVKELKQLMPNLICQGLGGVKMAEAGVELIHNLATEAVLGAGDVLRKYFHFRRIFYDALRRVRSFQPDAIVLIDYPGFNLRFAKKINHEFPVIYYISPQIWAWGGRRIHTIKKTVDHMIVFFEFEAQLYRGHEISVSCVGHPLVGQTIPSKRRHELRSEWLRNGSAETKAVALFPGSRKTEVMRILPEMLRVAHAINARKPTVHFFVSESETVPGELYERMIEKAQPNYTITLLRGHGVDLMYASDFAMVSSGTTTLEAALVGVPFVILYKTAWSTFFLGRHLIQIPYIGLVNVIAGRKIVPEFIQHEIRPETIAQEAAYLLDHQDLREKMILDLKAVQAKLGSEGASRRAAEVVVKLMRKTGKVDADQGTDLRTRFESIPSSLVGES